MKGQKLFVRPIENGDAAAIRAFLGVHGGRVGDAACGLVGKLVGELVAIVAMEIEADALRIDDIVVATELRRKRIGRLMLDELEKLASKLDRDRLVVPDQTDAREFFKRSGFEEEGTWLVRRVR